MIDIKCVKDGPILRFKNLENYQDTEMTYDLRQDVDEGFFIRIRHFKTAPDRVEQLSPEKARYFFKNGNLVCDDIKFDKVIALTRNHTKYRKYSNLARFICFLGSDVAKDYEKWLALPIKIEDLESVYISSKNRANGKIHGRSPYLHILPSDVQKDVMDIIIEKGSTDFREIRELTTLYGNGMIHVLKKLREMEKIPKYSDLFLYHTYAEEVSILHSTDYTSNRLRESLITCINEYNLDIEALCEFLHRIKNRERISVRKLLDYYPDYLRMCKSLVFGKMPKIPKYPENFLTEHQKVLSEYNTMKEYFDKKEFKESCDLHRDLEYSNKDYTIIVPNSPSDIEYEADEMHHCVRSYIGSIIKRKTLIVFLRSKEEPDVPLVTVEVKKGAITQAYAAYDRKPSLECLKFLTEWAKKKDIKVMWCWDNNFED